MILRNLVIMGSFEMAVTTTVGVEGMVIIDSPEVRDYHGLHATDHHGLQKHFTKGVMIGAIKG